MTGDHDALGHRVAVVTARYPPMDSTGTIRVRILRQHLPAHGIHPVVVTLPFAMARQQGRLVGEIDRHEADVLRPTSWSDPVVRMFSRVPVARRVQRAVLRPDLLVAWARAVPRQLAAVDELQRVNAVLATGPPFSALEAGRRLARRLGLPYVAELRDPPGLDRSTGGLGPVGTARVRRFTRACLAGADAVVVVTPSVKDHLVRTHAVPRDRIVVLPNSAPVVGAGAGSGFGAASGAGRAESGAGRAAPGAGPGEPGAEIVLAYVGSLRGPDDWRLLGELAEVLAARTPPGELRLVGSFCEVRGGVRTEFLHQPSTHGSGEVVTRDAAEVGMRSPGEVVTRVGRVDRDRALAEMAEADACLVFVGEDEPWWIGRKVLEGLGVARQLLAVAPPGDTTDLLAHSARSLVVDRTGVTRTDLERAVEQVAARRGAVPDGPEPLVPGDATLAAGIAGILDAVVRAAPLPADWSWRGRP